MSTFQIFGVNVADTNQGLALDWVKGYDFAQPGYCCLPNAFVIATAAEHLNVAAVLNAATQVWPDGKPLEWYARSKGHKQVSTVSGYWLMHELLQTNLRHYFYGSDAAGLELLARQLAAKYPQAQIAGMASPPFVAQDQIEGNEEMARQIATIADARPDIVWVGISSPKQDVLMHYFHRQLGHGLMIGVGAVFDYMSGRTRKSPEWMKRLGLRWLYRLAQDPKRLFAKYWHSNLAFARLWLAERRRG